MRTYANALPLQPLAVGGPNEGVGYFADGRGTDPSFETHKSDLSVPDGYVSSWERVRAFTRNRVVRLVAATAFTLGAAAACATQGESSTPAATAEATTDVGGGAGTESITPECYATFVSLGAAEQEACRVLVAGMEITDVNRLQGLDQARWASYYRHAALGEPAVLHNGLRAKIIDDPSGAESAALHFMVNHQASVYRLAWLMQHDPALAKDPRTLIALLGSDSTSSESYKLAASFAEHAPSQGQTADEYIRATSQSNNIFATLSAESITTQKAGEGRVFSFTATVNTTQGAQRTQTFTYYLYPYMEAHPDASGHAQEKPDDPNAPGAELFAQLGTALLARPAQISDATT